MNILNLKRITQKEIIPGFKARFVHAESFTIAHWEVEKGSSLPAHSHIHEQTTHVTEGEFKMTIDGETQVLQTGSIVVIPPNVPHFGKALTNCKITDTFCPRRDDYL